MLSILGGLGAATMWATATVCSSRSAPLIGAASALGWVMLVGFALALPAVVATGIPAGLDADALGWIVAAGAGNVLGLLLEYRGFRIGKVAIVAPIASTEGAIAARRPARRRRGGVRGSRVPVVRARRAPRDRRDRGARLAVRRPGSAGRVGVVPRATGPSPVRGRDDDRRRGRGPQRARRVTFRGCSALFRGAKGGF